MRCKPSSLIALVLFCIWTTGIFAQGSNSLSVKSTDDAFVGFMDSGKYDDGIRQFNHWLDNPELQADTATYWNALINRSKLYILLRKPDSARIVLPEIPEHVRLHYPVIYVLYQTQIGRIHQHLGQFRVVEQTLEKAIDDVLANALPPEDIMLSNLYINLAIAQNNQGNSDDALFNLRKAEKWMHDHQIDNARSLAVLHYNIASVLNQLGQREEYLVEANKAYHYNVEVYGKRHAISANTLNSVANGYKQIGQLDLALSTYREALQIYSEVVRPDYPLRAIVELNIGETLQDLGRHDEALPYLLASARHRVSNYGLHHYRVARAYKAVGDAYANIGEFDLALAKIDTALTSLGYAPDSAFPYAGVDAMFNLFYTMADRAEVMHLKAVASQRQEDYQHALDAYDAGIVVMEDLRTHFKGKLARGTLNQKSYRFFEPAIALCFEMYERSGNIGYVQQAVQYSDGAKDNDFYQSWSGQEPIVYQMLPDSISSREEQLHKDLVEFTSAYYSATSDSIRSLTRLRVDSTASRYSIFQEQLEETYPSYYRMVYEKTKLSPAQWASTLKARDTQVLSYFVGDSTMYGFLINADGQVHGKRLVFQEDLDADIINLYSPQTEYHRFCQDQYRALIAPFDALLDSTKRLTVIPDGVLAYLPYDVLANRAGESLISRFPVSYATSIHALKSNHVDNQNTPRWLGVAPDYDGGPALALASRGLDSLYRSGTFDTWINLPGAADEVKAIHATMGGSVWTGEQATEEAFKAHAAEFNVLHLSMHAWMDDQDPMLSTLIFSEPRDTSEDGSLYAHEILGLNLSADLAVLSACQTGLGALRRGEGMQSLGRSMTIAGVRSVVMSLWKVPDQSTQQLMSAFYRHLADGLDKDIALQMAKLDYLDSVTEPELRHPYFWAGFVLQGDTDALIRPGLSWIDSLILVLLGMTTLVLIRMEVGSS